MNKQPDPNATYVYNHFHIWRSSGDTFGSIDVAPGFLVHKVQSRPNGRGSFQFEKVDEPGVEYHTNYGWSLVLNTPENMAKFEVLKQAERARDEAQKAVEAAYREVETLKVYEPPQEGEASEC